MPEPGATISVSLSLSAAALFLSLPLSGTAEILLDLQEMSVVLPP